MFSFAGDVLGNHLVELISYFQKGHFYKFANSVIHLKKSKTDLPLLNYVVF